MDELKVEECCEGRLLIKFGVRLRLVWGMKCQDSFDWWSETREEGLTKTSNKDRIIESPKKLLELDLRNLWKPDLCQTLSLLTHTYVCTEKCSPSIPRLLQCLDISLLCFQTVQWDLRNRWSHATTWVRSFGTGEETRTRRSACG